MSVGPHSVPLLFRDSYLYVYVYTVNLHGGFCKEASHHEQSEAPVWQNKGCQVVFRSRQQNPDNPGELRSVLLVNPKGHASYIRRLVI